MDFELEIMETQLGHLMGAALPETSDRDFSTRVERLMHEIAVACDGHAIGEVVNALGSMMVLAIYGAKQKFDQRDISNVLKFRSKQ